MRITFHIQELGRLKDTSFDLHPFLIFTGDSNLGKSYCAFLVYGFLKSLETDLFADYLGKIFDFQEIIEKVKQNQEVKLVFTPKHLETFFNENIQGILGSLIGYEEVNCKVVLVLDGFDEINIAINLHKDLHKELKLLVFEINKWFLSIDAQLGMDNIAYQKTLYTFHQAIGINLISLIYSSPKKTTWILPPARGSILSFPYSMQKAVAANMRIYSEFLLDMDTLRQPDFGKREMNANMMAQIKNILGGEIKIRQNEIHYQFDNQSIPLTAAASSIKELAPLFLLLKKEEPNQISLLFEEPESHLHPAMQKKLADLLAYMVNKGAFLQITTHSSYFLTEWNNLLRLHFIREKNQESFEAALAETHTPVDCVLNPEKVGAYYFHVRQDGSVELRKSEITEQAQIQFDTFNDTVTELNENRYILMEKLAELTEKEHEREN